MNSYKEFLHNNKWKILGVLFGLVVTVLIFTINFWRTLLLVLVCALCFLIGSLMDQGGFNRVKQFFENILPRG